MASISERPCKNGNTGWQALVRVKGHRAVARTFDTFEEAKRFGEETEAALRKQVKREQRELNLARKSNPTLADYNEEELIDTLRAYQPAAVADPGEPHEDEEGPLGPAVPSGSSDRPAVEAPGLGVEQAGVPSVGQAAHRVRRFPQIRPRRQA